MTQKRKVLITNLLGLHARAAARFVNLANQYRSEIKLVRTDNKTSADGKSILSVMFLAALQKTELYLITEGEDEAQAIETLAKLIQEGFGENTDAT